MPVVDLFLRDYLLSELGDLLGHGKFREPQDGASLEGINPRIIPNLRTPPILPTFPPPTATASLLGAQLC